MNMRGLMIHVTDEKSSEAFLKACVNKLNGGFHPDTNFNDYIVLKTGKRTFTRENAKFLNMQIKKVFEFIENPYRISLRYLEALE